MKIHLNDTEIDVMEDITLIALLKEKEWDAQRGIAVAVNHAIIPKDKWEETRIQPKDKLTVITATAGG